MRSRIVGLIVTALLLGSANRASAQVTYRGPTAVFRDSQTAVPLFAVKPALGPFARDSGSAAPTALTIRLNGLAGDRISPTRCPIRTFLLDSTKQDRMPIAQPNLATVERMPVDRSSCTTLP